jgi:Lon protease-like protein
MQELLLPLFPLQVVLLPGSLLPLHIFEDRYKEMIQEAVRSRTEFGVVQAGEKGILNIGCTATVEKVTKEYPDGRIDIITVGRRRFEIHLLNEEKSYLRGAVSFFDDEDEEAPPMELRAVALAALDALRKTGAASVESLPEAADPQLSFKVAEHVPDLNFRQTLLSLRSEAQRLSQLADYLPAYLAALKRAAHIRRIAASNGHGFTGDQS